MKHWPEQLVSRFKRDLQHPNPPLGAPCTHLPSRRMSISLFLHVFPAPGIVPRRSRKGTCSLIDVQDRKSTRLNSSHVKISYAVFCLKKKMTEGRQRRR